MSHVGFCSSGLKLSFVFLKSKKVDLWNYWMRTVKEEMKSQYYEKYLIPSKYLYLYICWLVILFYYLNLYLIVFSLSCVLFGGRCHWLAATLHAHDESIKTHCTKRLFDLIANMNAVVHVQLNKHKDLISLSWNNPTVLNIQSMLTIPVWPADLCLFKQRNETCFFLKDQMNVFTSFQTCWVKRGNRFTLFLLVFFAVTKSLYLSLCWCWAEGALFYWKGKQDTLTCNLNNFL